MGCYGVQYLCRQAFAIFSAIIIKLGAKVMSALRSSLFIFFLSIRSSAYFRFQHGFSDWSLPKSAFI